MAKCKYCEKGGWFTTINNAFGLCDTCVQEHGALFLSAMKTAVRAVDTMKTAKKPETIMSKVAVLRQQCEILYRFEQKGVNSIDPPPSQLLSKMKLVEREVVEEAIQSALFNARQKAEDGVTDSAKLGGYTRAIEGLNKLLDDAQDVADIEMATLGLRHERDGLKAKLLCNKAEVQIAKGKDKKALEYYIEAFMSLKQDGTDDNAQVEQLTWIEGKIQDLGGTPPSIN
jgi:tetratricopeptide (TPR) repeat protein